MTWMDEYGTDGWMNEWSIHAKLLVMQEEVVKQKGLTEKHF